MQDVGCRVYQWCMGLEFRVKSVLIGVRVKGLPAPSDPAFCAA